MAVLKLAAKANQSITFAAALVASQVSRESQSGQSLSIEAEDTIVLGDSQDVVQYHDEKHSVGGFDEVVNELVNQWLATSSSSVHRSAVQEWVGRSKQFQTTNPQDIEAALVELDAHLTLRVFLVAYALSPADVAVWGAIRGNKIAYNAIKKGHLQNFTRWFKFLDETYSWIGQTVQTANTHALAKKAAKSAEGASYNISLPDTASGVVTRFPPEPSGYLHIGHAKAALLNDYFAHEEYNGTLICRFDDTNPSKERAEFQDAIVEDLALMGIKPDRMSYTSDYFDQLYCYCIKILELGKAYCDDTEKEKMQHERWHGIKSERRDANLTDNMARFEQMKSGSTEGVRWCVRAKISVDDPNKAMRDPVIYRCNPERHHRTGDKFKMYPTYDFACPIVDSLEGVTHALRTIEYRDRNPQYQWMIEALGLRKVHIWDFARMNFIRTVLSKRKLTKLVEAGIVWGWDDPRFPTIRGIRRRGMTIDALREFILKQGPSRNTVNFDWTLFWATNKKYIDPVAPRHTAIVSENAVTAIVHGAPEAAYTEARPKHGKNAAIGTKQVSFGPQILIEQVDAQSFAEGEEITLMSWGNAIVRKIDYAQEVTTTSTTNRIVINLELQLHLEGDVKTTKQKVTWLATDGQSLIPVDLVDFDYLINKDILEEGDELENFLNTNTEFHSHALADGNVADLKTDDIIQFERKGYFRVDRPYHDGQPAVLFNIPTGKAGK